jgi:hypothetical protein
VTGETGRDSFSRLLKETFSHGTSAFPPLKRRAITSCPAQAGLGASRAGIGEARLTADERGSWTIFITETRRHGEESGQEGTEGIAGVESCKSIFFGVEPGVAGIAGSRVNTGKGKSGRTTGRNTEEDSRHPRGPSRIRRLTSRPTIRPAK